MRVKPTKQERKTVFHAATIENFITRMGLEWNSIDGITWAVQPRTQQVTRIGVRLEDNVLTFSTPVMPREWTENGQDTKVYETLLRFNATQMLHAAYGIEGDMIILSGALEVENLDFNEFQAMIDDISLGIDSHFETIRKAA